MFSDILNLTINQDNRIIYRKDESASHWRKASTYNPSLQQAYQFCHMLSTLMFNCHITNAIVGNISLSDIQLGFDYQVTV